MDSLNELYTIFFQPNIRLFFALLMAISINSYAIPVIIRIAKQKHLFDFPDEHRKEHTEAVPTLGGIGFFASIAIVGSIMINAYGLGFTGVKNELTSLSSIVAGLTILFFMGMKDDLLNISPIKKLIAESLAILIIIIFGNLRLTSMQGMFGISDLRFIFSIALTYFAGIVIINAFNLIDGIDGLASSISMLASAVFGYLFHKAGDNEFTILATIVFGANIPFFYYNVFSKKNKIFMGDTGSLILGFMMTVFVIRFNELNVQNAYEPRISAAPAFAFSILIIPLFDTLRVFAIRILRGTSPFKADRRHLHHMLLDLGLNHLQTTILLIAVNCGIVAFAYFFNYLGNSVLLYSMLFIAILLSIMATLLLRKRNVSH